MVEQRDRAEMEDTVHVAAEERLISSLVTKGKISARSLSSRVPQLLLLI